MTGTDIIEIDRIEKAIASQKFAERVYTESERLHYVKKGNPAESAAGIFCAKEAVAKALGTGIAHGVNFSDIEIVFDEFGAPQVKLGGRAAEIFSQKKYSRASISISHCNSYAVAFCVML